MNDLHAEVIGLSDFNAYLKQLGKKAYVLEDSYLLTTNRDDFMEAFKDNQKVLTRNNSNLKPEKPMKISLYNSMVSDIFMVIVVEDVYLKGLDIRYEVFNYKDLEIKTYDLLNQKMKFKKILILGSFKRADDCREPRFKDHHFLYIDLYWFCLHHVSGGMFSLTTTREASDNVHRYDLLRKLGVEEKMIKHSLMTQIGVYFFMPLGLAIVHSTVGIKVASGVVQVIGNLNIFQNMVLTSGFLILIYGSYFIVTYVASVAMVLKQR